MSPKILRGVRITAALIFFLPLIFYFVDFAGIMPQSLAFALKFQFVPAILAGAWALRSRSDDTHLAVRTHLLLGNMPVRSNDGLRIAHIRTRQKEKL